MRQSLITACFATLLLGLAACSSEQDDNMIDPANDPEMHDDTGIIDYEDPANRQPEYSPEEFGGEIPER